jgi:hypothetical protein
MKKYLYLLLAVTLGSCDYLDVVPESKATFDDIFRAQTECQKFVYYMYQNIPNPMAHCWSPAYMAGDDYISGPGGPVNYFQYKSVLYGIENPSQSYFGYWWPGPDKDYGGHRTCYNIFESLRHCYMLLNNIDRVPDITPANYDTWRGEALFLIAHYHHILFNYYGPTVLIREEIPAGALGAENYLTRSTADECVKFICDMYDQAASLLPPKRPDAQLNLATSTAAKAFKAQILLTLASPLYNGNTEMADFVNKDGTHLINQNYDPEKWKAARDAAQEAITLCEQSFRLYDAPDANIADEFQRKVENYHDVFCKYQYNTDEYIFAIGSSYGIECIIRQSVPRSSNPDGSSSYYADGYRGDWSPTFEAAEMYFTRNGLPWDKDPETAGIDPYAYNEAAGTVNMHLHKEPRFYANVGYDRGTYDIDGTTITILARGGEKHGSVFDKSKEYQNCTGYFNKKFVNAQNLYNTTNKQFTYFDVNYPLMRMAELYLNYVEADFEYTGSLGTTALGYLDKVRSRAGLIGFEAAWAKAGGVPSGDELREVLHRERSIEFLNEGHRYFDLRRWKEAPEVMSRKPRAWNMDGRTAADFYRLVPLRETFERVWKSYWLAIPIQDLNVNPNLVQNPGY